MTARPGDTSSVRLRRDRRYTTPSTTTAPSAAPMIRLQFMLAEHGTAVVHA